MLGLGLELLFILLRLEQNAQHIISQKWKQDGWILYEVFVVEIFF